MKVKTKAQTYISAVTIKDTHYLRANLGREEPDQIQAKIPAPFGATVPLSKPRIPLRLVRSKSPETRGSAVVLSDSGDVIECNRIPVVAEQEGYHERVGRTGEGSWTVSLDS